MILAFFHGKVLTQSLVTRSLQSQKSKVCFRGLFAFRIAIIVPLAMYFRGQSQMANYYDFFELTEEKEVYLNKIKGLKVLNH